MSGGSGIRLLVMILVATVTVWAVLMLRPVLADEVRMEWWLWTPVPIQQDSLTGDGHTTSGRLNQNRCPEQDVSRGANCLLPSLSLLPPHCYLGFYLAGDLGVETRVSYVLANYH